MAEREPVNGWHPPDDLPDDMLDGWRANVPDQPPTPIRGEQYATDYGWRVPFDPDTTCLHCGHRWARHAPEVGCVDGWEYDEGGLAVKDGCRCRLVNLDV